MTKYWVAGLLALSLSCGYVGCSEDNDNDEITSEGVDPEKNPLGALSALMGMGGELEQLQEELESMPDVETAHFSDLIKALPDPPSGWTADEPNGSTNQMGDFQTSSASRSYRKEDSDERVDIQIDDWAFHKAVYLPFIMAAKFSQESTDGYNKGITVGDDPGREEYSKRRNRAERTVLHHKRYPVKVSVRNGDAETLDDWWALLKLDELPTE